MRGAKTAGAGRRSHRVAGAQGRGHLAGPAGGAGYARLLLVQLLQEAAVELLLSGQLLLAQLLEVAEGRTAQAAAGCLVGVMAVVLLVGEHVGGDGVGELVVEEVPGLVLLDMVHLLSQRL